MPSGTNGADEHVLGPYPETGVLVRCQVERVADTPWTRERCVGGAAEPEPGALRQFRSRRHSERFRMSGEHPGHVGFRTVVGHFQWSVAIVTSQCGDQISAALHLLNTVRILFGS